MTLKENGYQARVQRLLKKGVTIPAPHAVEIGEEVDPDRIAGRGVTLHAGTKIYGRRTLILKGTRIGFEGPVTIENCQIGPQVTLSGGFFKEAVFLEGAAMGLGAHVRNGTILEEKARAAHTVALKQTILFPFVTLGSLVNFCDCFMAGGNSPKNHSEVGSSFIHFNYTPNQDKATASLLGDVPAGVMLNQAPIFLGGQGGLVGPCRLAYGTVLAAGTVWRKDELRNGRLLFGGAGKAASLPYRPGQLGASKRIVINNAVYIANLVALMQWYRQVRSFFVDESFPQALLDGLTEKLSMAIDERIDRLGAYCRAASENRPQGPGRKASMPAEGGLARRWPEIEAVFRSAIDSDAATGERDAFLARLGLEIDRKGKHYLDVITGLALETAAAGTRWLDYIVNSLINKLDTYK